MLNPHGTYKVRMKRSGLLLVAISLFTGMILCPGRCLPATRILKTAYKAYTIETWKGIDILCEPYQIRKGDWILKIFKKKGNLSEMDFPLFLAIFQHLNPHIPDPDRIRPGQEIIIPLKKTDPHDFPTGASGRVMVPILQMSEVSDKIEAFIPQNHPKEVETLMLEPVPVTSAFQTRRDMERIEHYAAMVEGQLLNQGTYYFPGPGQKDITIDLTTTPIVQLKNNSKIIVLPHDLPQADSLRTLKGFRQDISFLDMNTLNMMDKLGQEPAMETTPISVIPEDKRSALKMLAQKAGFDLLPHETIIIMEGGIDISIKADRIPRNNQPDLLIFLGTVYGNALTILKHQGYTILSILPNDQGLEMSRKLFKALGISILANPVFMNRDTGQSLSIPGLFIGDDKNLFLSPQPVSRAVAYFFAKNRVAVLQFSGNRLSPKLPSKNGQLQRQAPGRRELP